ncbi:hypothetical protein F9Y84_09905 [Pseudoalteromonas peptidolytica]|nr:hypothetical protein [Pseudoalteromonas peptidolytica]
MRRENLVGNSTTASCYRFGTYIHVGKAKILQFSVLNKKFLMRLVSGLLLQIEQVLGLIGIRPNTCFFYIFYLETR